MGGAGKPARLVWLLRNHGEAIEADFARYYPSVDLLGVYRGELSFRRALVLVERLPYGAQTWMEMGVDAAWTVAEHGVANLVDQLAWVNFQINNPEHKGRKPDPVDRPPDLKAQQVKRERTLERAVRFRAKHGSPTPPKPPTQQPVPQPRDERGRFVKRS